MIASLALYSDPTSEPAPTLTLLDLVRGLVDAGASEPEVVAAVMDLLETRRVRLVGQIRAGVKADPTAVGSRQGEQPVSHPTRPAA